MLVAVRLLRPAPERLKRLVGETSRELGVPVSTARELVDLNANAMALPTSREVWFTTKLLEVAPDEEIKAVCAHELGHLNESRGAVTIRVAGSLILFPVVFIRPVFAFGGMDMVVSLFAGMSLCWLARQKWSRSKERLADTTAVEHRPNDPVFARALERIHRVNLIPASFKSQTMLSHPHLYDRLLAAKVVPEYARPKPPPSGGWTTACFAAAFAVLIASALPPSW